MLKNSIISKRSRIALYVLIAFFISLETIHLSLPAIHYDEATLGNVAYSISQGQFPLMLGSYHGAIEEYFLSPFIAAFGCNIISLRIFEILVGIFVILATYFTIREFFDEITAIITIILLTCNFTFLEVMKVGIAHGSIILFFMLYSLYFFLKWFRGKSNLNFYFGVFLLGVGLSVRIWFIWPILALLIMSVIFYDSLKKRISVLPSKCRFFIIAFLSVCVGSFVLIVHNLLFDFETIRYFFTGLQEFHYGINNFLYIENSLVRFRDFISLLKGTGFYQYMNFLEPWDSGFYLHMFVLALILLCFVALFIRRNLLFSIRKMLFFAIMLFLILFVSCFTLPTAGIHHIYLLLPLVCIVIAVSIRSFFYIVRPKFIIFVVSAFLVVVILKELSLFIQFKSYLNKSGGSGAYSEAVYNLTSYLEEEEIFNITVSHWPIGERVKFLSKGKIQYNCDEIYDDYETLFHSSSFYITYVDYNVLFMEKIFLNYSDFIKVSEKVNKRLTEKTKICKRDGKPIYVIYERIQ